MDIKNEKLNIEKAFTNHFYLVPDYQREYVWNIDNVTQLLDDINSSYSQDKKSEYFIGSIIVCNSDSDNETKKEVIDGQQRLTTLFLILCAFKKLLPDQSQAKSYVNQILKKTELKGENKYKLNLQYTETTDLITKIAEETINEENLIGSSKRIYDAYTCIKDYIKRIGKDDDLIEFLDYLAKKVNLIQIETPSISDALKIFETVNNRGVGLNPMDLLKNLVFQNIKKEDKNTWRDIKTSWSKFIKLLDKNNQKHLRFLRYFLMSNYDVKNKKGEEIVREDEIYDWITNKDNKKQCNYENDPLGFINNINENAEAYINFTKGLDTYGIKNVYLENIKYLSGSFSQHFILLLAARNFKKESFNFLCKQIETLIFYYIFTKSQTKELERKFSKWAKEIQIIVNEVNQKDKLNEFIVNNLIPEIKTKEKLFEVLFKEFNYETLQQYRLKYILAKISKYVDQQKLGEKEPDSLDNYIKSKIQIEHILPDSPTEELKLNFESINGIGTYDICKIKFGNLTLLEQPINGSIGRDYYNLKKEAYMKSNILLTKSIAIKENVGKNTSINRINVELITFTEWTKKSIEERQDMLFKLAKKIWKIEELK
jgi:uncharacterized protein with ParB-like and HNH nuclease domain